MLNDINSEEYYGNPDIVSQEYYGFRWREPYANMVAEILGGSGGESKGVAVGTNVDYLGMPKLIADKSEKPPVTVVNYLRNRTVMEAIAADDWCTLRALLPNDDGIYYQEKWWGISGLSEARSRWRVRKSCRFTLRHTEAKTSTRGRMKKECWMKSSSGFPDGRTS